MKQQAFQVTTRTKLLIGLGANTSIENRPLENTLVNALSGLHRPGFRLASQSRFFSTPCFPSGAGPDYVNAAAAFETSLSATEALALLHRVEQDFGRERIQRWGRRTLDLDMLAWGDSVLPDPATHAHWRDMPLDRQMRGAPDTLIVPHPRLADRAFVLIPLCDIAPGWVHPVSGKTVRQMAEALPDAEKKAVVPLFP